MAIKNIIARGIGFKPRNVKFIVTHGFGADVGIWTIRNEAGGTWTKKSEKTGDSWTKRSERTGDNWTKKEDV